MFGIAYRVQLSLPEQCSRLHRCSYCWKKKIKKLQKSRKPILMGSKDVYAN
jgi:hypothetical protein